MSTVHHPRKLRKRSPAPTVQVIPEPIAAAGEPLPCRTAASAWDAEYNSPDEWPDDTDNWHWEPIEEDMAAIRRTQDFDVKVPTVPATPLAEVFACWAAWHDHESYATGDMHDLLHTEIKCLGTIFEMNYLGSVGAFLATRAPFTSPSFDLADLTVPSRCVNTDLTADLDAEAARYLAMGTDASRLVAHTILGIAFIAEAHLCDTVAEYFAAVDRIEAENLVAIERHFAASDAIEAGFYLI